MPIWGPSEYTKDYSLSVSLNLEFGTGKWSIYENTLNLQNQIIEVKQSNLGIKGKWIKMELGFDGNKVQEIIGDNLVTGQYEVKSLTGVSGIGSD